MSLAHPESNSLGPNQDVHELHRKQSGILNEYICAPEPKDSPLRPSFLITYVWDGSSS